MKLNEPRRHKLEKWISRKLAKHAVNIQAYLRF